jgi:lysophospholipase L1-like esterase
VRYGLRWALAIAFVAGPLVATSGLAVGPGTPPTTTSTTAAPGLNPCAAGVPHPATLAVDTNRPGLVDLFYFSAGGEPVTYYECVGTHAHELGVQATVEGDDITPLLEAARWSCTVLDRTFAATATPAGQPFAEGITDVRTPSCAGRFRLEVPPGILPGRSADIRIVDEWGIGGITTKLCVVAPGASLPRCQTVPFASAANAADRSVRLPTAGRWTVSLLVDGFRTSATIAVGVAAAPPPRKAPTVLATGDSTIQGVDSFLADDLGERADVVGEEYPGAAISATPGAWAAMAQAQVDKLHPRATVISLGANEGFPMMTADGTIHACCDTEWTTELTVRIHQIMQVYLQGGRGRVLWMAIPAQNPPAREPTVVAVDTAIRAAAQGLTGVQVVPIDQIFSPDGYQQDIPWQGREVSVRLSDGVHLNISGTAIEAQIVAKALGAAF